MNNFVVVTLRMTEELFERFSHKAGDVDTVFLVSTLMNESPKVSPVVKPEGFLPKEDWKTSFVEEADSDGLIVARFYLTYNRDKSGKSGTLMQVWRVCQALSLLDETIECIACVYIHEHLSSLSMATHFMGVSLESYKLNLSDLLTSIPTLETFFPRETNCNESDYMDDVYTSRDHWYLDCLLNGGSASDTEMDFNLVANAIRGVVESAKPINITLPITGDKLFDTEVKRRKFLSLVDHQSLSKLLAQHGIKPNENVRLVMKPEFEFNGQTLQIKGKTLYADKYSCDNVTKIAVKFSDEEIKQAVKENNGESINMKDVVTKADATVIHQHAIGSKCFVFRFVERMRAATVDKGIKTPTKYEFVSFEKNTLTIKVTHSK